MEELTLENWNKPHIEKKHNRKWVLKQNYRGFTKGEIVTLDMGDDYIVSLHDQWGRPRILLGSDPMLTNEEIFEPLLEDTTVEKRFFHMNEVEQLLSLQRQATIAEKEKLIKAYKDLAEGRNKLLVCYRTGARVGYEGALDKIEKAEKIIAKLSPSQDNKEATNDCETR